jgi:hypothetical protein
MCSFTQKERDKDLALFIYMCLRHVSSLHRKNNQEEEGEGEGEGEDKEKEKENTATIMREKSIAQ